MDPGPVESAPATSQSTRIPQATAMAPTASSSTSSPKCQPTQPTKEQLLEEVHSVVQCIPTKAMPTHKSSLLPLFYLARKSPGTAGA